MAIKFEYGADFLDESNPGKPDVNKVYDTYGAEWNITREEYLERVRMQNKLEARVTPIGGIAPDFELELMSARGERTGTDVRLSDLLGRPVALAFGSYT